MKRVLKLIKLSPDLQAFASSIPDAAHVKASLFLGLLIAVMTRPLAERLDVVEVIELGLVASVRFYVISDRTVSRRMLAATNPTAPAAGVTITDMRLSLKIAPPGR